MENSKTWLFYIVGLAGLIILSILFTGRIEPPETEPLPTMAMPTVIAVRPTANPLEVDQKRCPSTAQEIIVGYIPETTSLEDNRLLISGTVYASDFVTPLSGVLIDMRQASQEGQDGYRFPPYYDIFHAWVLTGASGDYKFTLQKPGRYDVIYLHYQISDQDHCPLALQLSFVDEPAQDNNSATSFPRLQKIAQVELVGPLLRGSVDIVLPVPPLKP